MTPVLCDQLEAMRGEPGERYLRFLREIRAPIHAEDAAGLDARGEHELAAEVRRAAGDYTRAERAFEERGRDLIAAFGALERVELWTSAATHALLPLLATDAGLRLQLGHGDRLAHAPLRPLGRRLLAAGVRLRARPRARAGRRTGCGRSASTRRRSDGLRPPRCRSPPSRGPWPCRSTGRRSSWSGTTRTATRRIRATATTGAARFTTCVRGATRASPTTTRRRWRSPASTRVTS